MHFSVKKYIRHTFQAIILVFGAVSLIYSSFMAYSSIRSTLSEFSSAMQNYTEKLSSDLRSERDFSRTIVTSDPNFALISTNSASDAKCLPPLYNLRQIINYHDSNYCVNMLADSKSDSVYYQPTLFPAENFQPYRSAYHQIGNKAAAESAVFDQWIHEKIVNEDYLILQNQKGRMTLCTMFCLQKYIDYEPIPNLTNHSFVSIFSQDEIVSAQEMLSAHNIGLTDLKESLNDSHFSLHNGNLLLSYYVEECQLGIAIVTPLSEFLLLSSERFLVAVLFLTLMVLMFLAFYTITNRMLLIPVIEISAFSKKIEKTHDYSINKPSRIMEVQETQEALISLAKTISELESARRAEEEVKTHALLQYYQLQTRSHFFINCLKSLYGMLENRQIDKMKLMIIAFSNHLRYLFHDNISKVPLSFELREIEDYHQILSLDSGKVFLLNVDVEEGLEDCIVPPLIIQSFLENSFKYNDAKKSMVVFSVKINTVSENGHPYVCIHMQDNGNGYPQDVLEAINRRTEYSFENQHVGINNLKQRLFLLYGENYSFAFYNLPSGGACSTISIPLNRKTDC